MTSFYKVRKFFKSYKNENKKKIYQKFKMDKVAREICKEMLECRGYNVTSEEELYITANSNENEDKLVVFFSNENKCNIQQLKYYMKLTKEMELTHCIIVYPDQITSGAKRGIETQELEIELFSQKELQFNITKHILVPLHQKTDVNESKKIRKEFGHNLPLILSTDPIVRFYNFKKNDIIKITRKEGFVIYRMVK
jgi:DNA-directed RNA polymerase subunit H (RpoH/RPB5)